jgi:hypothetical protein
MKEGLYYQDVYGEQIYKCHNFTRCDYMLISSRGERLTISKPEAFRYAYQQVKSKKAIEKFEKELQSNMPLKWFDVYRIILSHDVLTNGRRKVLIKNNSDWYEIPIEDLKKDMIFRLQEPNGEEFKDIYGNSRFKAYGNSYTFTHIFDEWYIEVIRKN